MMPSGHKSFRVNNVKDVELLMMHNRTYAAEYVLSPEASMCKPLEGVQTADTPSPSQDRL